MSDDIEQAIEAADAFLVFVTPAALQPDWVADEVEFAHKVQRNRAKTKLTPSSNDLAFQRILRESLLARPRVYVEVAAIRFAFSKS